MGFLDKLLGKSESEKIFYEKDNMGTRHDTVEIANAYWWGERLAMEKKAPFSLYSFSSAKDAEESLLELPFIHKAADTGKLVCERVMVFGYYETKPGQAWEAVVCGFDLTLDEFNKVNDAFERHGGKRINTLEPDASVKAKKLTGTKTDNVVFREKFTKNQYTYEVYDAPSKDEAMTFLNSKNVDKKLYYVCVYTPEGNFGRDIMGIYEM